MPMATTTTALSVFTNGETLAEAQRAVKVFTASDLVPPAYRDGTNKGIANALIALDISRQLGISPLTVMQNLQVVEGVPSWKSSYLIERFVQSGIEPKYEFQERGKKTVKYTVWSGPKGDRRKEEKSLEIIDRACRFVAIRGDKETFGPWVSLEIAIQEGWYTRNGSKWATMPEKMLMYAAAREYNRFYPVVALNNIPTEDELGDWEPANPPSVAGVEILNDELAAANSGALADWEEADQAGDDDII